jgi:hypothetical protein
MTTRGVKRGGRTVLVAVAQVFVAFGDALDEFLEAERFGEGGVLFEIAPEFVGELRREVGRRASLRSLGLRWERLRSRRVPLGSVCHR